MTFVPGEGVKSSKIVVRGRVPGLDQAGFEEAARGAGELIQPEAGEVRRS